MFVAHADADPARAGYEGGGAEHAGGRHGMDRLRRRMWRGRLHDIDGERGGPLDGMMVVLQRVLLLHVRARRRGGSGGSEGASRAADLLQEGDEGGDAEDLGGDEEGVRPLGGDVDGADAVEDADDEADVVDGEGEAVGRQLPVQVHDSDGVGGIPEEELAEELAGGGEDDAVGADGDLVLADERDVGEVGEVEVVGERREHRVLLLVLERLDQLVDAAHLDNKFKRDRPKSHFSVPCLNLFRLFRTFIT